MAAASRRSGSRPSYAAQRPARIGSDLDTALQTVTGVDPGSSLQTKPQAAKAKVAAGDYRSAANILNAFANQLAAQTGKQIPNDVAVAVANQVGEASGLLTA
ncbi:MAG TPA: hypothetical protein VF134_02985 [Candidatus Dormibacteraeota bacterium]